MGWVWNRRDGQTGFAVLAMLALFGRVPDRLLRAYA